MNNQNKNRIGRRRKRRRGAAAVEFALIVPVMLTFTFGMIELSRLSMVKESITQASREGARIGIRPGVVTSDVLERIDEELALLGLENATVNISPAVLETAQPGDDVQVEISVPMSEASWVPGFFNFSATSIEAQTTMRRESTG